MFCSFSQVFPVHYRVQGRWHRKAGPVEQQSSSLCVCRPPQPALIVSSETQSWQHMCTYTHSRPWPWEKSNSLGWHVGEIISISLTELGGWDLLNPVFGVFFLSFFFSFFYFVSTHHLCLTSSSFSSSLSLPFMTCLFSILAITRAWSGVERVRDSITHLIRLSTCFPSCWMLYVNVPPGMPWNFINGHGMK